MLRMRVLAAAIAKWVRSAPRVILPASTTLRNSRKSPRSKRIRELPSWDPKPRYAKSRLCQRFERIRFRETRRQRAMSAAYPVEHHTYDVVIVGAGGAGM